MDTVVRVIYWGVLIIGAIVIVWSVWGVCRNWEG